MGAPGSACGSAARSGVGRQREFRGAASESGGGVVHTNRFADKLAPARAPVSEPGGTESCARSPHRVFKHGRNRFQQLHETQRIREVNLAILSKDLLCSG